MEVTSISRREKRHGFDLCTVQHVNCSIPDHAVQVHADRDRHEDLGHSHGRDAGDACGSPCRATKIRDPTAEESCVTASSTSKCSITIQPADPRVLVDVLSSVVRIFFGPFCMRSVIEENF